MNEPTLQDARDAHIRIRERLHRTPVLTSGTARRALAGRGCSSNVRISRRRARSRRAGALNAVLLLGDAEASRGVVTHSSGNHAAALSWAAALRGIPATVVMPRTASRVKMESVARYGRRIVLCEPTHAAREAEARRLVVETGAAMIHPYNDARIIAGQATAALELLEEVPDLDFIVCPVGGGGLLAGSARLRQEACARGSSVHARASRTGRPTPASRSLRACASRSSTPRALRTGCLARFVGDLTFPIIA